MDHDPMDNMFNDLARQRDKHYRDKRFNRNLFLVLGVIGLISFLSGVLS